MLEFLDSEWYDRVIPFRANDKTQKPWHNSPWSNETIELPMFKARLFARQARVREVRLKDQNVLEVLRPDIRRNGITNPLLVKIDKRGKMTLFDGYHRFVVAEDLNLSHVPVRFELCNALALESRHISDVVLALLA